MKTRIIHSPSKGKIKPPAIVAFFHPGHDMTHKEFSKKVKKIGPRKTRLQFIIEEERQTATLVSPLGIFSGKSRVEGGLQALEYVTRQVD